MVVPEHDGVRAGAEHLPEDEAHVEEGVVRAALAQAPQREQVEATVQEQRMELRGLGEGGCRGVEEILQSRVIMKVKLGC